MESNRRYSGVVPRLPPGFRFYPTDEELVVLYLRQKVLARPLPAPIIAEADVCKSDPWDLPGDAEQDRYFFSTREVKYPNGNRSNRATGSGYWKATGLDKRVVNKSNQVVGLKKTLVFYKGKPPKGTRTNWIMHEYRLSAPATADSAPPHDSWVVCKIFLKKRGGKSEEAEEVVLMVDGDRPASPGPVFIDFLGKDRAVGDGPPANSSSGSSGITEISKPNEAEDHEESSCNSFR